LRGEVRHGIRSHNGIVADVSADAFYDVTDTVRISAGPRVSFASSDYFDAYYGVNADEAAASGLSEYDPSGGIKSAGIGGAIDWKVTDRMTANVFGEYVRLLGSAEDSSLVRERGSKDQFMVGVSATYRLISSFEVYSVLAAADQTVTYSDRQSCIARNRHAWG
jgi:outer membrane protein